MTKQKTAVDKPDPSHDGVRHINVDKNAATELGRALAPWDHAPFKHPYLGSFHCIQGLWDWIRDPGRNDKFRTATGKRSKALSRQCGKIFVTDFQSIMACAYYYKLEQNPALMKLMTESELPFEYYYLHQTPDAGLALAVRPLNSEIMISIFEDARLYCIGEKPLPEIDYKKLLVAE